MAVVECSMAGVDSCLLTTLEGERKNVKWFQNAAKQHLHGSSLTHTSHLLISKFNWHTSFLKDAWMVKKCKANLDTPNQEFRKLGLPLDWYG